MSVILTVKALVLPDMEDVSENGKQIEIEIGDVTVTIIETETETETGEDTMVVTISPRTRRLKIVGADRTIGEPRIESAEVLDANAPTHNHLIVNRIENGMLGLGGLTPWEVVAADIIGEIGMAAPEVTKR